MEKIKREKYRISSVVALLLGASTLVSAPASKPSRARLLSTKLYFLIE